MTKGQKYTSLCVGERVGELRKQKGYSMRYLAELSGVSRSTISRWENKQLNPTQDKLKSVLKALGVSSREFWEVIPGWVYTDTNRKQDIKSCIDRIVHDLDDIQIAMNILRENHGIAIGMVQKLGTENSIYFNKGIKKAAESVSRTAKEKDSDFRPLTRMEFNYDWCKFVQHPEQKESHYYK